MAKQREKHSPRSPRRGSVASLPSKDELERAAAAHRNVPIKSRLVKILITFLCLLLCSSCYLILLAETRRLQSINQQLASQVVSLGGEVPAEADESQRGLIDGLETALFFGVVGVLVLFSLKFIKREYDLLERTRSKIPQTPAEDSTPEQELQLLIRQFVMYRLDYWFSASAYSKPVTLLSLTLVLIVGGGSLYYVAKPQQTVGHAFWQSWAFIADSGIHADEVSTGARVVALMLTIGGMLVFALVIGLISDAISEKFDSLKQGKARVVETDHTLVLGWSDKTLPLIREIANANESAVKDGSSNGVIVVLAEMDKEKMEQEIRESNIKLRGSMVVCRKGNPTVLHDLKHVSAETARSVVVLSPVGVSADEADARSLRVVLCLVGLGYQQGHITVEMADVDNRELVHIVGGDLVETVVAHDFIGRLIVQSSRQPGLAPILEKILGFEGNEFYMEEWPELVGKPFAEVLFSFEQAIPIGVRFADVTPDGEITLLNPPDDYVISHGDKVIVLAEDDDSYHASTRMLGEYPPPNLDLGSVAREEIPPKPEKVLLIGWRRDLGDMLHELDMVVGKGSELSLFNTIPVDEREEKLSANGRDAHHRLNNLSLKHSCGNPIVRRELERLPVEEFDSIFILADEEFEANMEAADGRSLTSLLLIYDIRQQRLHKRSCSGSPHRGLSRSGTFDDEFAIVSEVLDPRTRSLINLARVSDYVMSNEMVSAALAMVSECRDVNAILKELLSSDGNEIYVRNVEEYIQPGQELSFWEVMSIVRCHKSILLGYKAEESQNPELNPSNKNERRV
eukprot:Sspe_Gene.20976::Locus_7784_Transcript_1_1_Confidence_1.000_Length_2450::g.20976::m.20976/K21866/POLLUX, DMI1, CASTOR; ion channel POLLUX/CASTOR